MNKINVLIKLSTFKQSGECDLVVAYRTGVGCPGFDIYLGHVVSLNNTV